MLRACTCVCMLRLLPMVSSLFIGEMENIRSRRSTARGGAESHFLNFFFCRRHIEFVFVFSSPSYFSIPVLPLVTPEELSKASTSYYQTHNQLQEVSHCVFSCMAFSNSLLSEFVRFCSALPALYGCGNGSEAKVIDASLCSSAEQGVTGWLPISGGRQGKQERSKLRVSRASTIRGGSRDLHTERSCPRSV